MVCSISNDQPLSPPFDFVKTFGLLKLHLIYHHALIYWSRLIKLEQHTENVTLNFTSVLFSNDCTLPFSLLSLLSLTALSSLSGFWQTQTITNSHLALQFEMDFTNWCCTGPGEQVRLVVFAHPSAFEETQSLEQFTIKGEYRGRGCRKGRRNNPLHCVLPAHGRTSSG